MSSRTALIITSDPSAPGEKAIGHAFNALAAALELDHAGDDVLVQFQGTGTRWPGVLNDPTHPLTVRGRSLHDQGRLVRLRRSVVQR